ncbi:MAG: M20/M25/M40 family metallo-hydrolase [Ignavibacteriales bacterium]|nr:M20/M25/M40 family metallo-hydrolase [Ignavibacteriales bacterium]
MKTKLIKLLIIAFVCLLNTTFIFSQIKLDEKTSLTYLINNLQVLASDEFEGRETTTHGEKLASLFIASELGKYNVQPMGDNGTYFQNFNLLSSGYGLDSKITLVDNSGALISNFSMGDDFIRSGRGLADSSFAEQTTGIVFAGYGITAKEFNYDDYANIDVKGKTVLILSGEPYSEKDDFFSGEKPTSYSNSESKVKLAKEKGAIGVFIIVDERMKSFWNRFKEFATQPSISFISKEPQEFTKNIPVFIIGEVAAEKMLAGEKYSYEKINEILKTKSTFQSFEFNKKLKYNIKPFSKIVNARNVIGLIEGTDPILKNEFVVLSAHYDHLGTRGSVVNNGADDDGSGTVAVLESARLLESANQNKRSIIVLFNTGEEKGLLGSRYATENGSFMKDVVADINMDMVGRESIDSLYCIGSDKLSSEFAEIVKEENSKTVNFVLNYKFDEPNDPNRFYYRSDHYNFAKKGIPVVFFFDDMSADYHRPTDDVEKINFEKILKTLILSSNIALHTANLDHKVIVDKKAGEMPSRN